MRFSAIVTEDDANKPHGAQLDPEARESSDRREFLRSLGKWSTAAIGAIVLSESSAAGEVNDLGGWTSQGGGGWLNSRGGGGRWVNRRR